MYKVVKRIQRRKKTKQNLKQKKISVKKVKLIKRIKGKEKGKHPEKSFDYNFYNLYFIAA